MSPQRRKDIFSLRVRKSLTFAEPSPLLFFVFLFYLSVGVHSYGCFPRQKVLSWLCVGEGLTFHRLFYTWAEGKGLEVNL